MPTHSAEVIDGDEHGDLAVLDGRPRSYLFPTLMSTASGMIVPSWLRGP